MKRIGVSVSDFVIAIVQHSRSVLLPMTFDVYDVPEVAVKADEDSKPLKQKVLKLILLPSEKAVVEQYDPDVWIQSISPGQKCQCKAISTLEAEPTAASATT